MATRTIVILGLLIIAASAKASDTLVIKVTDFIGNIDSVILGYDDSATEGVDLNFNEANILNSDYSDLDLRVIHRTKPLDSSSGCLIPGTLGCMMPNTEEREMKVDFRQTPNYTNNPWFLIEVHAINYPITVEYSTVKMEYDIPFMLHDKVDYSGRSETSEISYLQREGKTEMFVFNSESENFLIGIYPQQIEDKVDVPFCVNLDMYPNPFSELLNIKSNLPIEKLTLFDLSGRTQLTIKPDENLNQTLDLSRIKSRIYFIDIQCNGKHVVKCVTKI